MLLKLIIHNTVHGPCVPIVAAEFNDDAFGSINAHEELMRLAAKIGATHYEVLTGIDAAIQGDLFPPLSAREQRKLKVVPNAR